jgi:hypothetical protein
MMITIAAALQLNDYDRGSNWMMIVIVATIE